MSRDRRVGLPPLRCRTRLPCVHPTPRPCTTPPVQFDQLLLSTCPCPCPFTPCSPILLFQAIYKTIFFGHATLKALRRPVKERSPLDRTAIRMGFVFLAYTAALPFLPWGQLLKDVHF